MIITNSSYNIYCCLVFSGAISTVFNVALVDVRFLHNGETFCRLSTIEQLGIGSGDIIQWALRQVGGSNTDSERKEELEKSVELQLNNLENTYTNLKEMYMRDADQLCEAKTEALNKMDCDDVLQDAEKEFKQRIDQCNEDAQEGIDAIRATLTHDSTRDKSKLAAIQVLEAGKIEEVDEIEVEKEEFISREKKRKVDSISHAFDAKINVKRQKIRKVQVGINTVQRLLPFDRGDAEEDVLNALKAHSMAAEAGKISTEDKSQDKVGTDTGIEDEDALVSMFILLDILRCCVLVIVISHVRDSSRSTIRMEVMKRKLQVYKMVHKIPTVATPKSSRLNTHIPFQHHGLAPHQIQNNKDANLLQVASINFIKRERLIFIRRRARIVSYLNCNPNINRLTKHHTRY